MSRIRSLSCIDNLIVVGLQYFTTKHAACNFYFKLNKENNVFKDGIGVQGLRFKVVKFDSLGLGTC